ncbi:DUF177 domain-containing protein [Oscillatoria sp. FACHB-1407]|uniref:YceD family protein n=1 Tax=Oscillatoria sp. FACHB-1407 TaxID=2692847 RepID=UPI001685B89C|nr:YceD family protein [Oscillatoria sp. FACHB-1407]MBD2462413.1 DUF177 domain-containing protein [Oscillatoria sp. FACHB-1407]
MDAIYIPQLLRAPEQTETLEIHDYLPGLETLTPVQGVVRVTHRGNYLEVVAQAETIITLTCDRCLKQYNHRLSIDTSELIWLDEAAADVDNLPLEREITLEELVESLHPQGHFHPDEWLYEQLCLEIPQRKLCDQECSGISLNDSLPEPSPSNGDRRWASLEALKRQFS